MLAISSTVNLVSPGPKFWWQLHAKLVGSIVVLVTSMLLLVLWYTLIYSGASDIGKAPIIKKTELSVLKNNEVSTHYINKVVNNAWVESADIHDASQIIIENIEQKSQQKIVFPAPLQRKVWYSQGSQRLLVQRIDKQSFYAITFMAQDNEPVINEYKTSLPSDSEILALDFTGNMLFVALNASNQVGLFDLEKGALIESALLPPALLNISQQVEQLLEQDESAIADLSVQIWPSPVSSAFIVNLSSEAHSTLIYYKSSLDEVASSELTLPNGLKSGVWNTRGDRFSFNDNNAGLIAFQAEEGRLTTFNTNGELINQVVADCGPNCFVISNTQGMPKLNEITFTFDALHNEAGFKQNVFASEQNAQVIRTNLMVRNESLPQYTQRGLYFVSQHNDSASILFRDNKNIESTLYTFAEQASVEELTIDADVQ